MRIRSEPLPFAARYSIGSGRILEMQGYESKQYLQTSFIEKDTKWNEGYETSHFPQIPSC